MEGGKEEREREGERREGGREEIKGGRERGRYREREGEKREREKKGQVCFTTVGSPSGVGGTGLA